MPYLIRVKLIKQRNDGFGFILEELSTFPCARVRKIVPEGVADENNLIRVGDIIQAVNDINVSQMTFASINGILDNIPTSQSVVLLLRCPSGCRTFVQTRIQSNGVPVTVRVSERQTGTTVLNLANNICDVSENESNIKSSQLPNFISKVDIHTNDRDVTSPKITNTLQTPQTCLDGSKAETCNGDRPYMANGVPESSERHNGTCASKTEVFNGGRQSGCPFSRKYVTLRNIMDESITLTDTLHKQADGTNACDERMCNGSIMTPSRSEERDRLLVMKEAVDFINQFYTSLKKCDSSAQQARCNQVRESIETTGTYQLTSSELSFGAKTAWRNASRCIGRMQWSKLQVFDARHIQTTGSMFDAICTHIKYATNKGTIRSAITVFPQRKDGKHDYRVWNSLLIAYAGYKQEDDSIIGDPAQVKFTEICMQLGWKGKGTKFDILPLVLQSNGQDPELFELPKSIVLEIDIHHPQYPCFEELGYKWFAVPAVSAMMFDCGGIQFPAVPFNGWYMNTEIVRDLTDIGRYNTLETVAREMGLNTSSNSTLWKDRALVEFNYAVLHSFQMANVTITDHHSASESFIKHMANEQRLRGGCPADWVWIVPPVSSSITPVFHQEMVNYHLKPNYEYQAAAWATHVWKRDKSCEDSSTSAIKATIRKKKFKFRDVARAVKFSAHLMGLALAKRVKCTILYATETGRSQHFANVLCDIFSRSFDVKVWCFEDYNISELEHEPLVIFVTSTFGNGDPPDNGESFSRDLLKLREELTKDEKTSDACNNNSINGIVSRDRKQNAMRSTIRKSRHLNAAVTSAVPMAGKKIPHFGSLDYGLNVFSSVRFSVFGLGSRAYPNFCAFAHFIDQSMEILGAERLCPIVEGDELCGQEQAFKEWASQVYKASCDTFCVGDTDTFNPSSCTMEVRDNAWTSSKFSIVAMAGCSVSRAEGLSKLHKKTVSTAMLTSRTNLQSVMSERRTINVNLNCNDNNLLVYEPGDHLAVFASNRASVVETLLTKINCEHSPDAVVQLQVSSKVMTPFGASIHWQPFDRFPVAMTVREAFTYYLDITTTPSIALIKLLATFATDNSERQMIESLVSDEHRYEDWRYTVSLGLVEFLELFKSIKPPATLLLSQLPLLKHRYYSVSSSMEAFPGQIHLTVAVVKYQRQGGSSPTYHGVCSTWLDSIAPGDDVPCFIRRSNAFRLPEEASSPLLLVGPGTGIAPFRGFWQQRQVDMNKDKLTQSGNCKTKFGEVTLYFGCRELNAFIYKDELNVAKQSGVLTDIHVALSRERGIPKTYVQHVLEKNSSDVYTTLVIKRGHFYVCGDVSMATDVCTTLENIIAKEGGVTLEEAKTYLMNLRDAGRIHEDIFGVTLHSSEVTKLQRENSKQIRRIASSKLLNT